MFQPVEKLLREDFARGKLIGRSKELQQVRERLDALRQAETQHAGSVVLLEGPPGSGKSTVCAEAIKV